MINNKETFFKIETPNYWEENQKKSAYLNYLSKYLNGQKIILQNKVKGGDDVQNIILQKVIENIDDVQNHMRDLSLLINSKTGKEKPNIKEIIGSLSDAEFRELEYFFEQRMRNELRLTKIHGVNNCMCYVCDYHEYDEWTINKCRKKEGLETFSNMSPKKIKRLAKIGR